MSAYSDRIRSLWAEVLYQQPSNGDLCSVIECVEDLRMEAATLLLSRVVSNAELCDVLTWVVPLREHVWQRMCAQGLTASDVRCVAESVDSRRVGEWSRIAWSQYLSQHILQPGPPREELRYVLQFGKNLRHEIGLWILGHSPTNADLCSIVVWVDSLRGDAWQDLLMRPPHNDELCQIVKHVPDLRVDAARRLLENYPDVTALRCVVEHVPQLRADAHDALNVAHRREQALVSLTCHPRF